MRKLLPLSSKQIDRTKVSVARRRRSRTDRFAVRIRSPRRVVIHRYCERDSIACGLRVSLEGAGIKYSLSGRIVKCLVTGWAHEDQRYDAPATIDDECEFGGGFAAQGRVDEVARHISFIDATDF